MLILLFYLFLGFLVSLVIHICVFLKIAYPPNWLITTLGIGINVVVLVAWIVSRKLKKATREKELIWITLECCPYWLKIVTGLIIVYGTVMFILCFIWPFSELHRTRNDDVAFNIVYRGFTALMLLFYSAFFTMLYCYRKLYKKFVRGDISILKANNIMSNHN